MSSSRTSATHGAEHMLHRKEINTAIDRTEVREARSNEAVLLVGMEIAMGVLVWMMKISERVVHPAIVSV